MSSMSLEERRAERRRKRQMEEENNYGGTKTEDEIHADIQERLARRRKEREERMTNMAASVATVNGEDDLERKRRERREQRLRASGDTDYTSTDDYSSRRNRRRGTDDNTAEDTYSYSSYRSRRERNYNGEETPIVNSEPVSSVPDTSEEDAAEERRRRQREEEEEEARRQAEREEEEERQRQAALEEERREEERREREARRREEEAEQQRQEEEERQRNDEAESESGSDESTEGDSHKENRTENKLFIEEDDLVTKEAPVDKLERVRQWNEESNNVDKHHKVDNRQNSDNLWYKNKNSTQKQPEISEKSKSVNRSSSFKEINNNKIKDKLNKFEHFKEESDNTKIVKDKAVLIPFVDKDGLKGKLQKFEKEIKDQKETPVKDATKQPSHPVKLELLTPQPHKLTAKLQQFEIAAKSQSASKPSSRNIQFELEKLGSKQRQRQSMLGRWSASESHINTTEGKDNLKRNVLDRWKSAARQHQNISSVTSPKERKEVLEKRLSGNTEFISSRFLEKASKSIEEATLPKTPVSPSQRNSYTQSHDQRKTSHSSETHSDKSEDLTRNQSRSKVTDRWQFNGTNSEVSSETPVKQSRGTVTNRWPFKGGDETVTATPTTIHTVSQARVVHSRESSLDNTYSNSTTSSIDGLSQSSRRSSYYNQREEEEEEERLRQEKEARMGAEDGQKKRGKRKGLGGLTPEKKKKLKQIIMQKAAEDLKKEALAKAQEKERFITERVGPLNTEGLGEAELRKLIKGLHDKLAQIHSEAYDIEFKLNKQEKELVDLNMKISDSRGKFAKPVLRKVNKTEQKFAKMTKKAEAKDDFRETLKSAHDDDEGAE